MCHQTIQIFECGHNTGSKVVKCNRPKDDCNEVFLRQELEDMPRPCAVCGPRMIRALANIRSHVIRNVAAVKQTSPTGKSTMMRGIGHNQRPGAAIMAIWHEFLSIIPKLSRLTLVGRRSGILLHLLSIFGVRFTSHWLLPHDKIQVSGSGQAPSQLLSAVSKSSMTFYLDSLLFSSR
jgi:hypothetical protein